jgi:transposase
VRDVFDYHSNFTEGFMAHAYSLDLRERILNDIDAGMSTEDAARKYSVSIAWAYSLKKQRRETGSIAPKEYHRGQERKLAPYEQEVRQLVADHPDATLVELHQQLPEAVHVSVPTLHNFLKHLKITWKKRRSMPPNNIGRTLLNNAKNGDDSKSSLSWKGLFSSTKRGPKRT